MVPLILLEKNYFLFFSKTVDAVGPHKNFRNHGRFFKENLGFCLRENFSFTIYAEKLVLDKDVSEQMFISILSVFSQGMKLFVPSRKLPKKRRILMR